MFFSSADQYVDYFRTQSVRNMLKKKESSVMLNVFNQLKVDCNMINHEEFKTDRKISIKRISAARRLPSIN